MIHCNSCGRQFNWREHLAGRQMKCKCGAPIVVPNEDPDAIAAPVASGGGAKIATAVGIVVVLFLIVGGVVSFQRYKARAAAEVESDQNLPGLDGRVAKMTRQLGAAEVVGWLKENNLRGIVGFYWTRELTIKYAQQWYDHGAKTVLAFGDTYTNCLAIELPDDKSKRQYFFDFADYFRHQSMGANRPGTLSPEAEHELDLREPPQLDVNQKYILLDFMPSQPGNIGPQLPF